jgi:hypothetical protein
VISIYAYAVLVGTGFGGAFVSMSTLVGNYFGANAFASIMGFLLPLNTIFGSSTPFFAGLVYDQMGSYTWSFVGVSVLALLGGALLPFAHPPKLQERVIWTNS